MGGAISISANNDTAELITKIWGEVGAFETMPSMAALKYPPHLTFAIYDQIDVRQLQDTVKSLFSGVGCVRVIFDKLRYFDASPLVLWASPKEPDILRELHAEIHDRIDPMGCHELYRPANWIAHCTLGNNISDTSRADALAYAEADFQPFEVIFDSVDCISFPPVSVASQLALQQSNS